MEDAKKKIRTKQQELDEAKKTYQNGLQELEQGKKQYEQGKAAYDAQYAEAQEQIQTGEQGWLHTEQNLIRDGMDIRHF